MRHNIFKISSLFFIFLYNEFFYIAKRRTALAVVVGREGSGCGVGISVKGSLKADGSVKKKIFTKFNVIHNLGKKTMLFTIRLSK
jgi:hypothetical protein